MTRIPRLGPPPKILQDIDQLRLYASTAEGRADMVRWQEQFDRHRADNEHNGRVIDQVLANLRTALAGFSA